MLFRVTVIFPVADLLGAAFSSSCLAVCFPSNRQNCRAVHSSQFYKIAILIEYLVFAVHYTWFYVNSLYSYAKRATVGDCFALFCIANYELLQFGTFNSTEPPLLFSKIVFQPPLSFHRPFQSFSS